MSYKVLVVLLALSTILFVVNVTLSGLAGATEGVVFKSQTGKISDKYPSFITPIGFTFLIWNLIFILIGASLIFIVVTTVQHMKKETLRNPIIFSAIAAGAFLVNQIFYITWLFVWDNESLLGAAIILLLIMITNWITLIVVSVNLHRSSDEHATRTSGTKLWTYRLLVQNAWATYTVWTTIATLVNINLALIYGDQHVDNRTSSIVMLGILLALVLLWFILDVFLLDRFFRYMVAPLLVVVWALTGIVVKLNKLPDAQKIEISDLSTLVYVVLVISAALAVIRIAVAVYRHYRTPQTV